MPAWKADYQRTIARDASESTLSTAGGLGLEVNHMLSLSIILTLHRVVELGLIAEPFYSSVAYAL